MYIIIYVFLVIELLHVHYNLRKHFVVIELLQFGIVFLTLFLMQSLLTYSRIVWIDSCLIKNLNLIGLLTSPESEIEVKLTNFIIIVHNLFRYGHRGLGPGSVTSSLDWIELKLI